MSALSKRILVVDDSATVRLYLRGLLAGWGYEVQTAVTGFEGLEKALASTFDLILADINMPTMNGYAMVAALRRDAATQAVPVAMVSTESRAGDAEQAYCVGANLYLVKPIQPHVLQRCVRFAIGEVEA